MNPPGWKRASLPKLPVSTSQVLLENALDQESIRGMTWSQRGEFLRPFIQGRQERQWEEETHVSPEDSIFTLIVPIHNEEHSLESFLGTLMLSNVPCTVYMQIVFVTNACTDRSFAILREFLAGIGPLHLTETQEGWKDPGIDNQFATVEVKHVTFLHLNTSTAGKANALRIGNNLARQRGDMIAISIDANNFVEPDAIGKMFAHAHGAFRTAPEQNETVLFSGVARECVKSSKLDGVIAKVNVDKGHLVDVGSGVVNGWMLAWNTEWMSSFDGPPEVALEDYALGVLARANHFKIEQAEGVYVWGYTVNDFGGLVNTRARYIRGKRQIYDYVHNDPSVVSIIENEAFYMKKFPARLHYLLQRIAGEPLHSARLLATFLLWEYAIWKGMRAYRRNPRNQSWEKISSTY